MSPGPEEKLTCLQNIFVKSKLLDKYNYNVTISFLVFYLRGGKVFGSPRTYKSLLNICGVLKDKVLI